MYVQNTDPVVLSLYQSFVFGIHGSTKKHYDPFRQSRKLRTET